MSTYFFTADEHYGHTNIIKYCDRPFATVEEMDVELARLHNSVVTDNDIVVHAGDFTLRRGEDAQRYVEALNGTHIFLRGSHDQWLDKTAHEIWEKKLSGQHIVVCHYAMRVWGLSHYNSWQLYGHSHGGLPPVGKQWDVGVDNNNYLPLSLKQVTEIMETLPDNRNFLKKAR